MDGTKRILMVIGLAVAVVAGDGCGRATNDATLIVFFNEHEASFERLAKLVADNSATTHGEIATLKSQLGIANISTGEGSTILFELPTAQSGTKGFKGYAYSVAPLERVVRSLDRVDTLTPYIWHYRNVAHNWYLYYIGDGS